MRTAVANYLDSERRAVEEGINELRAYTPFRKLDLQQTEEHDEEGF